MVLAVCISLGDWVNQALADRSLGATPVALANMDAVTGRFGPSPKALMVIALVGAFFIDLLNAGTIKFLIGVLSTWLG